MDIYMDIHIHGNPGDYRWCNVLWWHVYNDLTVTRR